MHRVSATFEDPLTVPAPEPVGVAHAFVVHGPVRGLVHMGAARPFGGHIVELFVHGVPRCFSCARC